MSSANNTIDSGEEGQAADRERSPAEIAALDKSRSLFGNPSATPVTPRDPTPDVGEGVGMETDDQEPVEQDEPEQKPEEAMDTADSGEPAVEEEVFEKKVVSMDTDEALEDTTLNDTEDVEDEKEPSEESVASEDEDDAPKKKRKRAASTSEDEQYDNQEPEQEPEEPVEQEPEEQEAEQHELQEQLEEQPEVQELQEQEPEEQLDEQPEEPEEQELEEQKNGAVESTQEDSDESASLQIDESAERSVEQEVEEPEEEEATPRAAKKSTGRRGRSSGVLMEEEEAPEEETESSKKRSRRSAAQAAPEVVADDAEEAPEAQEVEEAPEDVTPARRGRGRRSAAVPEVAEVPEAPEDTETSGRRGRASRAAKKVEETPEDTETPKRGRSRRSAAAPATPRSTRKAKNPEPEEEVEEETTSPTRKSTRTPKGRKAKVEEPEDVEGADEETEEPEDAEEPEAPTTSTRRSTRAKATPKSSATPASAKRTPARGRKQEPEDVETPKRGRAAAKKTPGSSSHQDDFDPYDMDTEMEHHPVPLKNIQGLQMEVQNFGAVKYAKAGTSEAKYSMTEKTAESRISELQGASASKNRRSLADMTPGKEKVKHRAPATSSGRKSRAKKDEEEEDVDMEEVEETPTSSAAAATPSNRGKKRKSEASMPSAKKQAQNLIPQLDEEQQLVVDHPSDENEPYAPGARVYAVFTKMFYPAVIIAERDGLGRYKLQFVTDKIVKDVPNSGIIPLRDIVEGKKAFIEDDLFLVESGPNDFSAKDWALGQITLRCVDDDGEPTEEKKLVEWTEISFESSEWRDYIKNKEQTATAVVASNITTVSEATRARKPLPVAPKQSNGRKDKKKNGGGLAESRGASTLREEDENELLPLHEKAVGKNIFAGRVFMLTSANRHSNSHVPAMFRKKNLMEFIMQNGGVVTEQLTDFQERYAGQNMLLISDTYYRTHKYLAALANGIPCVHNVWLQKCAEAGEVVPYEPHILPAGASLFDESDQPAPENPSKLLEDKVLYVHSTHTAREKTQTGPGGTFVEIWSPMLKLLGATIIEDDWEKVLSEEQKYDVVLVDGTFRDEVLDYTRKIGAKAVTSEWVIQTIILGRAPEPDSHPKFDPYRLHHRPRHSP